MTAAPEWLAGGGDAGFDEIADALRDTGYVVVNDAFSADLVTRWFVHLKALEARGFRRAGVGRASLHQFNRFVRGDEIHWLEWGEPALADWFAWVEALRLALNRRLFLGLFDYECHFAKYPPGTFYRRHLDAFGDFGRSRVISTVLYLTANWAPGDGGELVLYGADDGERARIEPCFGRLVLFLSEEFPHEVLRVHRPRYSLTGWYRINAPIGRATGAP